MSNNATKLGILWLAEAEDSLLGDVKQKCDVLEAGWKISRQVLSEDEIIELARGREILVTSYDKITRRVLTESTSLKLVICTRSNPVNVDVAAAHDCGVTVAYTPGRNSDATAEFAVALLLDVSRNVTRANRAIMSHQIVTDHQERPGELKSDTTWGEVKGTRPYTFFEGPQLKGKNVGICGFGSIGQRVGSIINGFGAEILVYDPYLPESVLQQYNGRLVDFETLLRESDFITCHMKITDETKGMFDYRAFEKMKSTAYFINNSRGAIVIEPDLIDALRNHEIAGAALDVFEYEPLYAGHPFVTGELDNVVVTPHISGASADAIRNHTAMVLDEIERYLSGDKPVHAK